MNPSFAEQCSLRGIIGAGLGLMLTLAGSDGCASHQSSQNVAPTHRSDSSGAIARPYTNSTIGKPHITVVDLSKKFLAFFDSASRTPLDRDARWAMWQRLYGFAARPPGPFGDTLARRLFEGAWERYPAALPRIRQGAKGFGFVPDSVLRQVAELLGCGADTHVQLIAFVGGFEANAFAFPAPDGTQTIALPVEAGDARGALVHELTHAVHHSKTCANITSGYEMSLPELVLSEGLAMRVAERLIPGYPSIHYIGGTQAWFDSADSRRTAILKGIQQHISDLGGATAQRFTFGNGTTGLGREGYYAGWVITGALLDRGVSLHQMATTPSSQLPALISRGIVWEEREGSAHAGSLATQGKAQLDVRLEPDEVDAALAILDKHARHQLPTPADWRRLFESSGYQHLRERESSMRRAFTDSTFSAFPLFCVGARRAHHQRRFGAAPGIHILRSAGAMVHGWMAHGINHREGAWS
jgi:Predicted Zn-dependent protease (DUF2268)